MARDLRGLQRIPSIPELVTALDEVIVGHSLAKRALATAAFRHYLGLRRGANGDGGSYGKQHVLLIGSSGTGKTRMVRELGKVLGQAMTVTSATSLVETGYVGDHVEDVIGSLCASANGNLQLVERGIVFIDEIDKTRRSPDVSRDVSGAGVQNALLKLLDGVRVSVKDRGQTQWISTDNMFFVFSGAFEGLDEVRQKRTVGRDPIGFGTSAPRKGRGAKPGAVETDDLIEYGMVREFIGRMSTISHLSDLGVGELERILVEPRDSWLNRTRAFFANLGVELRVSPAAIEHIAREAYQKKTGARALDLVASRMLEPTLTELVQSEQPVRRIDVTRRTLEEGHRARFHRAAGAESGASESALQGFWLTGPSSTSGPCRSAQRWTNEWYANELAQLERTLRFDDAQLIARSWWRELVQRHQDDLTLVHYLAEQLVERESTVQEFYDASIRCETDSLKGALLYHDYKRVRDQEARAKKGSD